MGLSHSKEKDYDSTPASCAHSENFHRKRRRNQWAKINQVEPYCAARFRRKLLFGQALSVICDKNCNPPKPIMEILVVLYRKGPSTEGVFRKAGNVKVLKDIQEQLNNGLDVDLKNQPVILLAALLKNFLSQLPGSLLIVGKYQAWMKAMKKENFHERCTALQLVIKTLPAPNSVLLKYLIVLLHHINANADRNKMNSSNLAVCVSPNLLQANCETLSNVFKLTQLLIENCREIFGEDALTLYGDPEEEE